MCFRDKNFCGDWDSNPTRTVFRLLDEPPSHEKKPISGGLYQKSKSYYVTPFDEFAPSWNLITIFFFYLMLISFITPGDYGH